MCPGYTYNRRTTSLSLIFWSVNSTSTKAHSCFGTLDEP